jgi:hypothetical protein
MVRCIVLGLGVLLLACGDDPPSAPECTPTGAACPAEGGDECCTGLCDETLGVCVREPGTCLGSGEDCGSGPDCCSFSCVDFQCSGDQCTSDDESCSSDGQCCSGICLDGSCAPLNPACRTSGNTCDTNGECCSGYCKDGVCNNAPSFCIQTGDTCSADDECCGGMCTISGGATLGTCAVVPAGGATGCAAAGELCGAGADYMGEGLPVCGGECCSRACFPYGPTGALICQPPSGCLPTGEVCHEDSDCCGSAGNPDGEISNVTCEKEGTNPTGRCNNGNSCSPAGAICRLQDIECNANSNCCAGNVLQFDTCAQDNLGIPRCRVAELDCTDPTEYEGDPCATAADCCGLPCVPVPGSEFDLVCGSGCQPTDGTCTIDADCCSGPCTDGICGPPGECANYGQTCDDANPCCTNLECSVNGICEAIIP